MEKMDGEVSGSCRYYKKSDRVFVHVFTKGAGYCTLKGEILCQDLLTIEHYVVWIYKWSKEKVFHYSYIEPDLEKFKFNEDE